MGNRSKRGHWNLKRHIINGLSIEQKRLISGHGTATPTQKKSAPQERGAERCASRLHRILNTSLKDGVILLVFKETIN